MLAEQNGISLYTQCNGQEINSVCFPPFYTFKGPWSVFCLCFFHTPFHSFKVVSEPFPSPLKKKKKKQNKPGRIPLLLLTPKNMIMKQKLCSSVQFDVFFMLPQWWPNNWLFTCVLVSPDSSTDALNNAPKTAFSRGKSSLIIPGWQHKGTPASGAGTKQWLLGARIKKTNQFKLWE